MPQIYRRHSEYAPRPAPEARRRSIPQLMDADDSIVLSDLVRTGEASRLRRRGAMRLEHRAPRPLLTGSPTIPPSLPRFAPPPPPPRTAVVPPARSSSPPWTPNALGASAVGDDGDAFSFSTEGWRSDWRPGQWAPEDIAGDAYAPPMDTDEDRRDGKPNEPEKEYLLVCGGEDVSYTAKEYVQPFRPSIIPLSSRRTTAMPSRPSPSDSTAQRLNGCGAIIHTRAIPHRRRGVWQGVAHTAPTDIVVSLDSSYFDRGVVAKMLRSACGCVREGIGCAVCGNPLGTRYLPCPAASEGIFSTPSSSSSAHHPHAPTSSVRARPRYPSGPNYWNGSRPSTSRSKSGNFFVYTFFADRVSSQPPLSDFTPLPTRRERAREDEILPTIAVGTSSTLEPIPMERQEETAETWYGFRATASPRPYSYSDSSTEVLESPSLQSAPIALTALEDGESAMTYDRLGGMLNADGELVDPDAEVDDLRDAAMPNSSDNDKSSNELIMLPGR